MMFVIVPNELRDAINALLDELIEKHSDAERDRESLYGELLAYYNEHGTLPPREALSLRKTKAAERKEQRP